MAASRRRSALAATVLALLGAFASTQVAQPVPEAATAPPPYSGTAVLGPARPVGPRPRVAVMVLENRDWNEVIGNRQAPFLNRLARTWVLATHDYALGHPSLPNYLGLLSGSTHPSVDPLCGTGCVVRGRSLVSQLDAARLSWRAYFQSLPHAGFAGGPSRHLHRAGTVYARAYDPFVYFRRVLSRPADRRRVVPFERLSSDLARRRLPRFSWAAPDLLHDGHNRSIAVADRFAAHLVPRLLKALGPHGLLLLTWDEGRDRHQAGIAGPGTGGGHVPLILAGALAPHGVRIDAPLDHYAVLATVESLFHLRPLGQAGGPWVRPLLRPSIRPALERRS